ncbi:MAG: hypothetical protein AAGD07_14705 [Planctomycetota bacterium]
MVPFAYSGIRNRVLWLAALATFSCTHGIAQELDGLISDPQTLVGKSITLTPVRGNAETGVITRVFCPEQGSFKLGYFELRSLQGRKRRFKPELIKDLVIAGRELDLIHQRPTKNFQLIDVANAREAALARMKPLNATWTDLHNAEEHARTTRASKQNLEAAIKGLALARVAGVAEGENTIVLTDYPPQQRVLLLRTIDTFVPRFNQIFGYQEDALVLPEKPVVAVFSSRENLGEFQREVVKNPNYGTIRAFFHLVDKHIVVTAEDDRSLRHACWQAAWGLSGAYAKFSTSTVVLPAWFRVGLQLNSADQLVPKLNNTSYERKRLKEEVDGGSLNGLLGANVLPLDRQAICKFLVAHLYSQDPISFGQMLRLLKRARSTEDALSIAYGISEEEFIQSFGQTIGVPNLTP